MNAPDPDQDHQLLTSWLTVIGALTMFWSPVERHIDQCVHFLHQQLIKQKKLKKPKKPLRLGCKLDFIKSNMPVGIIDIQELESLSEQTKSTVQIRDVCVHGLLISYDQQKIEINKVNGKYDEHCIENFTIDRNRLEKLAGKLCLLHQQWGSIASALFEHATNA